MIPPTSWIFEDGILEDGSRHFLSGGLGFVSRKRGVRRGVFRQHRIVLLGWHRTLQNSNVFFIRLDISLQS